jgi:hypothetical protein
MSSSMVRTLILDFLDVNAPTESVVDLTSQFGEVKEFIADAGVQPDSPWLGVQFIGSDEVPIELAATNVQGKYRESGAIFIHVVDVARLGVGATLLTRGEALRNLFRGTRIGSIIIESVAPLNFDGGATLAFEGGYMSGSFQMAYISDIDL